MQIKAENFIFYLKKHNEQALEYVIDHYAWLVKSIVKKHLYNLPDYQEDCINEVFLGVWHNIASFDPNKNAFKNWLAGITKYKTIDYRRKYLKSLQNLSLEGLEIAAADEVDSELIKQELNEDLAKLLKSLKNQDRQLFYKLYIEEQDVASISKETGLKKAVIYNRISRGKQKLRRMLPVLERRE